MDSKTSLRELAGFFSRLGFTAFGGPAAHIALMQKEVVDRRGWMDHQHFLDLVGATNLIPGPNSTEMAIHIGYERGGWKGLLVGGVCFILPAVLITGLVAWLYQRYGPLPGVDAWVYGIKAAIIPIILAAALALAKRAVKTVTLGVIGVIVLVACLLGLDEVYAMFGAGLYGSGSVLFAFLGKELVAKGLLSRSTLMDAIAVGQFTPGPVFSSVTFIGWQMGGWQAAGWATLGVFLPSFLLVGLLNPLVPRMRRSKMFSAVLDGVNVASVAIILVVCWTFGRATVMDWKTGLITLLSAGVVFGFPKLNTALVVFGGSLLGYGLTFI
jgi:chromate transporter